MKFIPQAVTRTVAKSVFKTQKASPTLLFAGGVVAFGATVFLAAKATLRVEEEVVEPAAKELFHIQEANLSEKFEQKAKLDVYLRAAGSLGKLYGPALVTGAVSVACFTQSHRILSKRNAALTVAYSAVDRAFREYRSRVQAELGQEKEQELYHSAKEVQFVEETKTGPKIVTSKRHGDASLSPYAVFFDENNRNWQATPEFRFLFLKATQNWCNKQLDRDGFLFLNDVYDELGFPKTPAGSQVGWLIESKGGVDGFVSLGFEDPHREDSFLDFMLGDQGVWLDFNVDGVMWDKI